MKVRVYSAGSFGVVAPALLTLLTMLPATAVGQSAEVTFTKDVAPILQNSCQTCHRDGAIAPMSLMTYEDVRPWARAIKDEGVDARDAALVHRQERRRAGLQVRPVAQR